MEINRSTKIQRMGDKDIQMQINTERDTELQLAI